MKVQAADNNNYKPNFGLKSIIIDDALQYANKNVLKAILGALTEDTYRLGGDVEIKIVPSQCLGIGELPRIRSIKGATDFDNGIKDSNDVVAGIVAHLEKFYPETMPTAKDIFAAVKAKATALNPKD